MYQFYLDGVLLPVAPSSLTIKVENQNKTVPLVNESQINILKQPGLTKISFGALLPNQSYPFAQYRDGFQPAQYFMDKLERLKTGCRPFEFLLLRTTDNGNQLTASQPMLVSLEGYELTEDADKYGFDMFAKIDLLQYRPYKTKEIKFQQKQSQTTATVKTKRDPPTKLAPKTYTVVKGDNLWDIARKKLGNGSRSAEIYRLNKDVIEAAAKKYGRASSSNGWWIYPGTILRLP